MTNSYLHCPNGHTTATSAEPPVCSTCGYTPGPIIEDIIDTVLTEELGPNHQEVLSGGRPIEAFKW